MRLRDLSGEGQAAYINEVAKSDDTTGFRHRLATPIAGASGLDATVPPVLDRTLVVTVRKATAAGIGDRLMRTIVTIKPVEEAFTFTGYTIAATETQIQDIAHLETKTEGSVEAALAPPIKGFGDNSVTGKLSQSHTTTADIIQQYEKLNVDIQPREMVITRESERGLDVVGNTIIRLTITPVSTAKLFLVTGQKLYAKNVMVDPSKASLEIAAISIPRRCALNADVSMTYRLRHVVKGVEYYTEGKQRVAIVDGVIEDKDVVLVSDEDSQPRLWRIGSQVGNFEMTAKTVDDRSYAVAFDNYDAAQQFRAWLAKTRAKTVGTDGTLLLFNNKAIVGLPVVQPYVRSCTGPLPLAGQ